jgi:hypothetical protein
LLLPLSGPRLRSLWSLLFVIVKKKKKKKEPRVDKKNRSGFVLPRALSLNISLYSFPSRSETSAYGKQDSGGEIQK